MNVRCDFWDRCISVSCPCKTWHELTESCNREFCTRVLAHCKTQEAIRAIRDAGYKSPEEVAELVKTARQDGYEPTRLKRGR